VKVKVYIGTDLEGVAGVVSFTDQSSSTGRYYDAAKKLLTAEVNAAVDGLLDAGVTEALVSDGHGPGAISFEDLHPQAKLMHGRPLAPRSVRNPIIAKYDACVMIGQHAMAGVATGNQNHTQSSRTIDYYTLNGRRIGEIAQFALCQGALGLPLIFLSGDEAACREAEELIAGLTTVAVKKGLGRGSAISLSASESRHRIREGVGLAVERHRQSPIPALQWPGPYVLEKRFFFTHDADTSASQPGAERVDSQTVRFYSDAILDIIYR
jgi:D-amino peptidase